MPLSGGCPSGGSPGCRAAENSENLDRKSIKIHSKIVFSHRETMKKCSKFSALRAAINNMIVTSLKANYTVMIKNRREAAKIFGGTVSGGSAACRGGAPAPELLSEGCPSEGCPRG